MFTKTNKVIDEALGEARKEGKSGDELLGRLEKTLEGIQDAIEFDLKRMVAVVFYECMTGEKCTVIDHTDYSSLARYPCGIFGEMPMVREKCDEILERAMEKSRAKVIEDLPKSAEFTDAVVESINKKQLK